jgi:hypothetical protein
MGHFAKVVDGTVTQVIVAEPEFFDTFVDSSPGEWIQTSYNTRGNVHYNPNSQEPSGQPAVRGNYAGVGFTYDRVNDVFYASRPRSRTGVVFNSWTCDAGTNWLWAPPTPMPTEEGKFYDWDEATTSWVEVAGI